MTDEQAMAEKRAVLHRIAIEEADCDCCAGNPRTVCDACGEHACWAGRFMCEDSQTAGTYDLDADSGSLSEDEERERSDWSR